MKGVLMTKMVQELNLTNLTPEIDLSEMRIMTAEINRPALQLTGYLEHFANERVQIIGYVEYTYLMQLSDEKRIMKYERFISSKIPCVIFSTMTKPSQDMIDMAIKYNVPTFVTERTTSSLMAEIIRWLGVQLAPCISIHGVLVDVYGEGILITGESGIGKSEAALELIKRGHRLVSDDVVELRKVSDVTLVGSAPDITRHFIELRGIGIIDVKTLFGVESVKDTQSVDLVIKLEEWARDKYVSTSELNRILREEIAILLSENHSDDLADWELPADHKPYVILVVGVNGVGKTTTIGKLAYQFKKAGKKVVLGAADTFRAAAVEQICIWGERVGVPVVKQQMGSDPASVAFDTLQSAKANGADVVLIDTAGRLHNKVNLMNELKKIKEVMKKLMPEAPDEVMLVLDGSTGQNAFEQAKQFSAVTNISSLAITKLDGTAKGGVVIGISDQLKVPVKYIGLGEGMEDLQLFNKTEFVDSLFKN